MKYFSVYSDSANKDSFSLTLKAKNLSKAWSKIGKELKKQNIKIGAMKSESDEQKAIIVSEISKKYFKFLKQD